MADRNQMIEVFNDTMAMIEENGELQQAVRASIQGSRIWKAEETPALPEKRFARTEVAVSASRSLEAALRLLEENPGARVMAHNFASATNPGGGVKNGSMARCAVAPPSIRCCPMLLSGKDFTGSTGICATPATRTPASGLRGLWR